MKLSYIKILLCLLSIIIPSYSFGQNKQSIQMPWDSIRVQKAKMGDADSQAYVGYCFFYGEDGVIENNAQAFRWFTRSKNNGSPFGKYYLGLCYLNGYGTQVNEKLGRRLCDTASEEIERLAEAGNVDALFYLGDAYYYEAEDLKKALKYYLQASELGDVRSQIAAASVYSSLYGNLSNKVHDMYAKALENNSPIAQYYFVHYYSSGYEGEVSIEEIVELCRRSANSGYHPAMVKLGEFYQGGRGVNKDINKAIYWYKRALPYDNYDAEYILGVLYKEGRDVDRNYNLAVKYLRMANKHETEEAATALSELLSMGAVKFKKLPLRSSPEDEIKLEPNDPFLTMVLSDNWYELPQDIREESQLDFKIESIRKWGKERATKVAQHLVEIGFTEEQLKYSQGISPRFYHAKTVYYPNGRMRIIEYPHCTYYLINDKLIAMQWSHGLRVGDLKIIKSYSGNYVIIDENP